MCWEVAAAVRDVQATTHGGGPLRVGKGGALMSRSTDPTQGFQCGASPTDARIPLSLQ